MVEKILESPIYSKGMPKRNAQKECRNEDSFKVPIIATKILPIESNPFVVLDKREREPKRIVALTE